MSKNDLTIKNYMENLLEDENIEQLIIFLLKKFVGVYIFYQKYFLIKL